MPKSATVAGPCLRDISSHLDRFLNAYDAAKSLVEGRLGSGQYIASQALRGELEPLRSALAPIARGGFEGPALVVAHVAALIDVVRGLADRWDKHRTMRLDPNERAILHAALAAFAGTTSPSTDTSTTPGTPSAGTTEAKGTPGNPRRRRGQALFDDERKTYLRVIRTAKRLKLQYRLAGSNAKIAAAAGVEVGVVVKVMKWGRKHGRI